MAPSVRSRSRRLSTPCRLAVVLFLAPAAAQAVPAISLIWRATGNSAVAAPTASASSTILADLVLTGDSINVSGVFVTIEFDATELQAIDMRELTTAEVAPGNEFSTLLQGPNTFSGPAIDNTNGFVYGFDSGSLTGGCVNCTITLGSVQFHVVRASGDASDIDIVASLVNAGLDEINGTLGPRCTTADPSTCDFVGASVVPEPAMVVLVLTGLAGIGYASRRC